MIFRTVALCGHASVCINVLVISDDDTDH